MTSINKKWFGHFIPFLVVELLTKDWLRERQQKEQSNHAKKEGH